MGVQLNIKDPETVRLARELAGRTGKSVTETVRTALTRAHEEERRARTERLARIDTVLADVDRNLSHESRSMTSKEMMDAIYDHGSPDGFAR